MFLKSLKISSPSEVIREINFHMGLNLIVDETPTENDQITGNNVGKTTVLKLIDFCLGGDSHQIYIDPESKRDKYKLVEEFLVKNEVLITLTLTSDFEDQNATEIVIERNFLQRNKKVQRINGIDQKNDEFEKTLCELIFSEFCLEKPTFRQITAHNIRYLDERINKTLVVNTFTSKVEYETLYLFLLGCNFKDGDLKQQIVAKLKQEENYKARLERDQTKTAYEATLSIIEFEIEELNKRKSKLNINENFKKDLNELNDIKYKINRKSSEISNLRLRRSIIIEAKEELSASESKIDLHQLKLIYDQATSKIDKIQKTFGELVDYHNRMIVEKIKFITKELPLLEEQIENETHILEGLLIKEKTLSEILAKSDSFEDLERLMGEINEKYRKKGEYESIIAQIAEVESNISGYNTQLKEIDNLLYSDDFEQNVKNRLNEFNKIFATVSNKLYGEQYVLKYDLVPDRKTKKIIYQFSCFNANMGSEKKQGEILCFDIAYTIFADKEDIPCLHFLLNDKKELMHDNQLVKIANFIEAKNIQLVASILKDKLPGELNKEEYFVVKLSQSDKLFRIESR